MHDSTTNRRRFLVAAVTFAGFAAGPMGPAMLRSSRAWAQAGAGVDANTLETMVRMARLLFPHAAITDSVYADVLNQALAATAADGSFELLLEGTEYALDSMQPGRFVDLDEQDQLAALRANQNAEFFVAIQGAVRTGVYNHPAFWELIDYPGPSYAQGGYLNRGAGEIDWLPEGE